jgi:hypothetical protein
MSSDEFVRSYLTRGQRFLFEGSIWRFLSAMQLTNVIR